MAPIDEFLVARLTQDLADQGVRADQITVVSGEAENWQYLVTAAGRTFDIGFNHRKQLWGFEVTVGLEQPLVSNDEPRIALSDAARRRAVERIAGALAAPAVLRRDPPTL